MEVSRMRTHRMVNSFGFSLVVALAGGILLTPAAEAADPKPATIGAPQSAAVASGAVEDTLAVCLARIPQGATIGQRLVAEQSCQRDDSGRTAIQAVPGR